MRQADQTDVDGIDLLDDDVGACGGTTGQITPEQPPLGVEGKTVITLEKGLASRQRGTDDEGETSAAIGGDLQPLSALVEVGGDNVAGVCRVDRDGRLV